MSSTTAPLAEPSAVDDRPVVSDALGFGLAFAMLMTIAQRGVGFIRNMVYCRLMTEAELGQWSLSWSYLMLLAPVAALGLPGCFCRFVEHYRTNEQLGPFLRRSALVTALGTGVLVVGLVAFAKQSAVLLFGTVEAESTVYALAMALVPVAIFNYLSSLVESLRQVRLVTTMRFLLGMVFAGLTIPALILVTSHRADWATALYGLSCLVAVAPAIWFLKQSRIWKDQLQPLASSTMWQRIAPFAAWLWLVNIVSNLFEVSDRWMLVQFSDRAPLAAQGLVGQYHSARVIPLVLIGIATVLDGLLLPYLTAAWEGRRHREGRRILNNSVRLVAIGFTLASSMLLIVAPWVFDHWLDGRYQSGLEVLGPSLALAVWFSLFLLAQGWLWVAEKGKWVLGITVAGLILNLILNAWWIPWWGLPGAVMATTSATLICLVLVLFANRFVECPIEWRTWCTAMLPVALAFPAEFQLGLAGLVAIAAWRTDWLMTTSDREFFYRIAQSAWRRATGNRR